MGDNSEQNEGVEEVRRTLEQAKGEALSDQHNKFVEEYLCDLNATAAAVRAGYSAKGAAKRGPALLEIPRIRREIERRLEDRMKRMQLTQDYVLARLKVEAEYEGPGASHAARVTALQLMGRHMGMFDEAFTLKDERKLVSIVKRTAKKEPARKKKKVPEAKALPQKNNQKDASSKAVH